MRELTLTEVEQVSGANIYATGAALVTSIASGRIIPTIVSSIAVGNDISNNYLSEQQKAGIGYTVNQMINHPINSIENAIGYW